MIHTSDMTHSYVWHDSFICVTWLIHTCDMTHSHVWFLLVHVNSLKHFVDHSTETSRYEALCDMINSLQHAATRCNTLLHTATHCNTLQHTATHCNTLQHTLCWPFYWNVMLWSPVWYDSFICVTWLIHYTAARCKTLLHTARQYNTLQHTTSNCLFTIQLKCRAMKPCATWLIACISLQHTATYCNKLEDTGRYCNTLQRTATHYNIL